MDELIEYLSLTPVEAAGVVIGTIVMYAVFGIILHMWGSRLRASNSPITMAVAALMGAIAARSTLGPNPTMLAGIIALATLLIMERLFGRIRQATKHIHFHQPHESKATPQSRTPSDEASARRRRQISLSRRSK
ncbi:hypothetical protein EBF03_02635 [Arcanobacterium haemolyticum]|uniref:hypothetical protein n=1 Tax=Arcanobacterium haemolyticum TaxID=28264 RepID=UPI000D83CFB9|nr:hypothetical protein [Arcanobacterium haemolyticum]QCX46424.1 hypothetical protein EBF03_02635 [Arcanobacterium haemolyticum]SPT75232.1 Uncharacterised protein [Arcanobacterium haemolyticum]